MHLKRSIAHQSVTAILLLLLSSSIATSQTTFQFGFGGGLISPMADYGGSAGDYYNGTKFGLHEGWMIHLKARSRGTWLGSFGEVGYCSLNNSGAVQAGRIDVGQKILYVKGGPEAQLVIPDVPLTPYIGADVGVNFFGGTTTFDNIPNVQSGTYTTTGGTRVGLGLDLGALITIAPGYALDFNVGYNFMNILGWNWQQGQGRRIDSYLALNDDVDPQFTPADGNHFVGKARHIQTLVVSLSLMLQSSHAPD